MSIQFRIN